METKPLTITESRIYDVGIHAPGHFIAAADMKRLFPDLNENDIQNALNKLISSDMVVAKSNTRLEIQFEFIQNYQDLQGLEMSEKILYWAIRDSAEKGIWKRQLRMRTQMTEKACNKALKTLESRSLIKCVADSASLTRQVYKLYEYAKAEEEATGPWYQGNGIDDKFLDMLRRLLTSVLSGKPLHLGDNMNSQLLLERASARKLAPLKSDPSSRLVNPKETAAVLPDLEELTEYAKVITKEKSRMNPHHVANLLDLMIADGEVESLTVLDSNGRKKQVYRAILRPHEIPSALLDVPQDVYDLPPIMDDLIYLAPPKKARLSEHHINGPPSGSRGRTVNGNANRLRKTAFNSFTRPTVTQVQDVTAHPRLFVDDSVNIS